jgi:hypothetical protein
MDAGSVNTARGSQSTLGLTAKAADSVPAAQIQKAAPVRVPPGSTVDPTNRRRFIEEPAPDQQRAIPAVQTATDFGLSERVEELQARLATADENYLAALQKNVSIGNTITNALYARNPEIAKSAVLAHQPQSLSDQAGKLRLEWFKAESLLADKGLRKDEDKQKQLAKVLCDVAAACKQSEQSEQSGAGENVALKALRGRIGAAMRDVRVKRMFSKLADKSELNAALTALNIPKPRTKTQVRRGLIKGIKFTGMALGAAVGGSLMVGGAIVRGVVGAPFGLAVYARGSWALRNLPKNNIYAARLSNHAFGVAFGRLARLMLTSDQLQYTRADGTSTSYPRKDDDTLAQIIDDAKRTS